MKMMTTNQRDWEQGDRTRNQADETKTRDEMETRPELGSGEPVTIQQDNIFWRDLIAAADWCCNTTVEAPVKVPSVLNMQKEKQLKSLQTLHDFKGEYNESSPAELFTFAFKKRQDFEKLMSELVDKRKFKVFAGFEEQ